MGRSAQSGFSVDPASTIILIQRFQPCQLKKGEVLWAVSYLGGVTRLSVQSLLLI